jgi:hypothetical protein
MGGEVVLHSHCPPREEAGVCLLACAGKAWVRLPLLSTILRMSFEMGKDNQGLGSCA